MSVRLIMPGSELMGRAVRDAERGTHRAQQRALRKTAQWAGRQSARELARANRIPLRVLQRRPWERRTGRAGRMRWTIEDDRANVWLGTLPVRAAYIGTLKQQKRGARAGRHTFRGAFVASMPATRSGNRHRGIFKRAERLSARSRGWTSGRPRSSPRNLPIREQRVHLENAAQVEASVGAQLPARHRELLRQESRFEQHKWARRYGGGR